MKKIPSLLLLICIIVAIIVVFIGVFLQKIEFLRNHENIYFFLICIIYSLIVFIIIKILLRRK